MSWVELSQQVSIDLTRMECKGSGRTKFLLEERRIDLTRMECKAETGGRPSVDYDSIDLTRMECKDQRDPVAAVS